MLKLLKFGASYCAPCRSLTPILEELKDKVTIEDIDVDEVDPVVLTNYKIRNIPVLIITKDNVEVWRHVGSISKIDLENKLKEYETN
jgi:thioredoxin|uniref:TRX family protein n=1 Tax=Siphoviridae sp. gcode 4 TaxID=2838368 RepID=A0A8S5RU94_9CAUD|nr:MAG TPA_asm: TRX family protein [Siphoviridae sp. gcode 4]